MKIRKTLRSTYYISFAGGHKLITGCQREKEKENDYFQFQNVKMKYSFSGLVTYMYNLLEN